MSSSGFHNKYRPRTLDRVLGNSQAVRTLSTFIEKNQYPSAILITGPTSAGKTTLGRAFAADSLGVESVESSPNFEDVNFSESRTIDDVRALISQSRLRPLNGTRRFIVCDEAHGILSNAPAANAFLKPLEEPVPSTTWILSSMEGDKFSGTQLGKAIAGRCVHIRLKPPSREDLRNYAGQIAKAEKLKGIDLDSLLDSGDGTYRGLAGQLEIYSTLKANPEEALDKIL
jgi:DNA polymerase III subunit gamma/tau